MTKKERKQHNEFIRGLSLLTQIGVSMAACVMIGVFLGKFLDNFFGTSPLLLLLFAFLGVAAAFKSLFDLALKK